MISAYRYALSVAILSAVMSAVCSADPAGRPQPIAVQLGLSKAEYAFGEAIQAMVAIENSSTQSQYVSPFAGGQTRLSSPLLVEGDGRPIPRWGEALFSTDFLVLAPGQSVTLQYSGLYLPPGRHRLRVRLRFNGDMVPLGDWADRGVWEGEADSNVAEVVVTEGILTAAAQEESDRQMVALAERVVRASAEQRKRVLWCVAPYMPRSREYVRAMLHDAEPSVRASAVYVVGQLADPTDGNAVQGQMDLSLLGDVLALAQREQAERVRRAICTILWRAPDVLSDAQRALAAQALARYVAQMESGDLAGRAAKAYMALDPAAAAQAIAERMAKPDGQEADFMYLLRSALRQRVGTYDVAEGLRVLREGG